jgi:hypothetical protein
MIKSCSTIKAVFLECRMNLWPLPPTPTVHDRWPAPLWSVWAAHARRVRDEEVRTA